MIDPPLDRSSMFSGSAGAAEHIRSKLTDHTPDIIDPNDLTPAAIALIVMECRGDASVLLTVRTDEVEHHKGEISFPGGRMDEGDESLLAAALRETHEEIGLEPSGLECLGQLDDIISISSYLVTPYVFHLTDKAPTFKAQPSEVAEIIAVPLQHLLEPDNHHLDYSYNTVKPLHFFQWEDKTIWGLTGGVLHQLLNIAFDFRS
jgi:8-oxo-dGTP pyrophosphatase MutT (NUDIX family)